MSTSLSTWAVKWNIPFDAVQDLQKQFGVIGDDKQPASGSSETAIQNLIRVEASKRGMRMWRNNVGAVTTDDNRHIRFGLANDSASMNKIVKSSDLIGIRPILITTGQVGQTIGQFVAREVKHGAWSYTGTEREIAQLAFITLINGMGGDAAFANKEGTL